MYYLWRPLYGTYLEQTLVGIVRAIRPVDFVAHNMNVGLAQRILT
jgi:hypothetical protein